MKERKKIKINSDIERILKNFCFKKNKNIDEFVEEAILEKIEMEECREKSDEIIENNEFQQEILNEYLEDVFEIYKKKH